MGSGWGLGLFSKLVQAGSLTFISATYWGYLLHVEHISCVITNCVLLFIQCLCRPYWNEDQMLSENDYPYLFDLYFKICSSVAFLIFCVFLLIYHDFLCNRRFSRLAKILDYKDCYFPYYLSCLTLGLFCASLSATSWGYLLHVEHMSCVVTNCVQHQWVIPSLFSMFL